MRVEPSLMGLATHERNPTEFPYPFQFLGKVQREGSLKALTPGTKQPYLHSDLGLLGSKTMRNKFVCVFFS